MLRASYSRLADRAAVSAAKPSPKYFNVSPGYLKSFAGNTFQFIRQTVVDTLMLRPFETTPNEKILFDSQTSGILSLEEWGLGCDQDIGGYSTVKLSLTKQEKWSNLCGNPVRFSGNISLALNPGSDALYSGFAALRTKMPLPRHLFDSRCIDCSRWNYLVMRLRGDHRTYSINFKTSRSFAGDLYSCQFKFLTPYEWEEIVIPFQYFIRTNCGTEYLRQYAPNMEQIQSFGFLLADSVPGPFSLEIDYVKVSNLDHAFIEMDPSRPETMTNSNGPDPTILTQHLTDPRKVRKDFRDSVITNFGFGMDIGPGAIETAEKRHEKQWRSAMNSRVDNPQWVLELVEDRKPKKLQRKAAAK